MESSSFRWQRHHGVRKRGEVLDVILKENPGIKVLAEHNIDYKNFYEEITKDHGKITSINMEKISKGVWAGWDEPGMAAAAAIQAAGLKRSDIFVVGIDGNSAAIDQMKKDSPFTATVAQGFEVMGEKIGKIIEKYFG